MPRPGKLLFTGLPLGDRTVADIPFHIIDPAKNEGRSFVVLHSPRSAGEDRLAEGGEDSGGRPRQAAVPAGQRARLVLGRPRDRAAGAQSRQYDICYADGQTQTVPLITGRTIDEWTAAPEAEEVCAGAEGRTRGT